MWIVLCSANDYAALWAHRGLLKRGLRPLELVTIESLAWGANWEHRLGAAAAACRITLRDGRELDTASLRGALNRLAYVPLNAAALARPEERQYVIQELTSFFMSWLYALPGVVLNRATPQGLGGEWKHISQWTILAAQAGLPVRPYRMAADTWPDGHAGYPRGGQLMYFVLHGSRVIGPEAPSEILEGCRRLARLSGEGLLGIELSEDFRFAGASPLPDLRLGGKPLLDALVCAFRGAP